MRSQLAGYAPSDAGQQALRRDFLLRLDAGALRREDQPSHLTASAVVLDVSRRAVLLVLHRKVGLWLQPGGHLEDGDTDLAAAALREAVEETGVADLRLASTVPFRLDRHPAPCGAEHHLDVQFLVLARDAATPAVSEESLDVRWFALDALPEQRIDLGPMVAAALAA
ncbi:MAG: hydrolase [Frankiales bacterium]|nr:hydrolase [Frankiales bacterium]